MKYKVGDKVKVKSKEWFNDNYKGVSFKCGSQVFTEAMSEYCGQILTIYEVSEEYAKYRIADTCFNWTDEMLEDTTPNKSPIVSMNWIEAMSSCGCFTPKMDYMDTLLLQYNPFAGTFHQMSEKTHSINLIGKHKSLTLKIKS